MTVNPAIQGLGYQDVRGLSAADPRPRLQISVCTMPRDAGPLWGAGPVGRWAVSGAIGWQALLSTGRSGPWIGILVQTWVRASSGADGVQSDVLMLTGAMPMRLASVLVSSPKLTARRSDKAQGEMVTKKGTESGSARIMRKTPTPSPRTMFESQPVPVHCTACSSYLTESVSDVKGKKKKDWEKNKITPLLKFLSNNFWIRRWR